MSPVAGLTIASLWVVVIRGAKNPLVVEVRSRTAVDAGVLIPIPTFPEKIAFPGPAGAAGYPTASDAPTVAYVLTFKSPTTSSLAVGVVVPIPTLSFKASIDKVLVSNESPLVPPVKAKLVSLENVQASAFAVTVSPDASPKTVFPFTVKVPIDVNPDVAVIKPEIVGVAVQEVPETVKFPPREVKLLPETVKVLSSVVAPCKVSDPGVILEPIVFTDEAPVPRVVDPDEVRVVKAPVEGMVAPMAVPLIPVAVVLKLPDVKVILLAPVFIEEADRPDKVKAPEVPVKFKAPVVSVNPEENRPVPVTSRAVPGATFPTPTLPLAKTVRASFPAADTWNGLRDEPEAVVTFNRYPVPVLFKVSVRLKRLLAPVAALYVKVEVYAPIVRARLAVGSVKPLHEPPPPPTAPHEVPLKTLY